MRRSTAMFVAGALVFALAGCGTSDTVADPNDRLLEKWSVDDRPVGRLATAGKALVSYVRSGDGLALSAWDAASGDILWSFPAVHGAATPGIEIVSVAVDTSVGGFTAYLAPIMGSEWQRLVVADIRTGVALDVGVPAVWALSSPSQCEDRSSFCVRGRLDGVEGVQDIRVDPVAGGYLAHPAAGGDAVRPLGMFVHSTNDRAPDGVEVLQYIEDDGAVRWMRTYEEVFGVGASSDGGWQWLDGSDRKVLLGSGTVYPATALAVIRGGGVGAVDLPTTSRIVALAADEGSTAWAISGARFCPRMDMDTLLAGARVVPLCLYTAGTEKGWLGESGEVETALDKVAVDMIGVAIETGDIVWRIPLDPQAFADVKAGGFVATTEALIAPTPSGASLVDINTGAQAAMAKEAVLACAVPRQPLSLIGPGDSAGEPRMLNAGEGWYACDRHGRAAGGVSSLAARSAGLALEGGFRALSGDDGITVVDPGQ